jgi:hypothetical protein
VGQAQVRVLDRAYRESFQFPVSGFLFSRSCPSLFSNHVSLALSSGSSSQNTRGFSRNPSHPMLCYDCSQTGKSHKNASPPPASASAHLKPPPTFPSLPGPSRALRLLSCLFVFVFCPECIDVIYKCHRRVDWAGMDPPYQK